MKEYILLYKDSTTEPRYYEVVPEHILSAAENDEDHWSNKEKAFVFPAERFNECMLQAIKTKLF